MISLSAVLGRIVEQDDFYYLHRTNDIKLEDI